MLDSSAEGTERGAQVLDGAVSKIGLKINIDKTKMMELQFQDDYNDTGS